MFDKNKIAEKVRERLDWAAKMSPQALSNFLIPLNQENTLFLLETPEEDLGLSVIGEGADLSVHLFPGEDLFSYGHRITINQHQLFRFIDVD